MSTKAGITRPADASELSDADKLQAIEFANGIVKGSA